jgi:hypothetical protein
VTILQQCLARQGNKEEPQERGRASLPDRPVMFRIPSGKLTKSYGKSPSLMGKSAISMVIFNSYVTNYQRVSMFESV